MLLWLTLLSVVPPITVGPDSASKAGLLDAPIARVTVFEDRARVTRRAKVAVPAGASVWRLPDIPGTADVGALRATVTGGARLLRVEAAPVERDSLPLEPAMRLLDQIDLLDDAVKRIDLEREVIAMRAQILAQIMPAAPVPEAQREGRAAAGMFVDAWTRTTSYLSAERAALRNKLTALEADRRAKTEQIEKTRAEVARLGIDRSAGWVVETVVVLESATPTNATVDLEYFVPGARWRPSYAIHFFADQGRAELAAFGMVTQSTGEDWKDVELSLSTAIPSLGIELPVLPTWTLGEAKEWRPQVLARTTPMLPPSFPPPVPGPTAFEQDRQIERAMLMARISSAGSPAAKNDEWGASANGDFSRQPYGGEEVKKAQRSVNAPPPAPPPPPPAVARPAPSRVYAAQVAGAAPAAQPEYYDQPVTIASESLSVSDKRSGGAVRALALFEAPPPPPMNLDPASPAALAGGLDHVYVVPTRATVAADGEAFRAPLGSETHPVTAFYEATPALAPEAYLRATVTNRSPRPILGGPVGIFLGNAFAGDGELATTGAGGTLALPLGGDEDVRVSRKMISSTETKGVFSKDDLTTYRVILEIASFKTKPITVVVREPVPKTGREDVHVELLSMKPKAVGPDADGIVRWDIEVAPGKVQTAELVYRVKRPAHWRLYQR